MPIYRVGIFRGATKIVAQEDKAIAVAELDTVATMKNGWKEADRLRFEFARSQREYLRGPEKVQKSVENYQITAFARQDHADQISEMHVDSARRAVYQAIIDAKRQPPLEDELLDSLGDAAHRMRGRLKSLGNSIHRSLAIKKAAEAHTFSGSGTVLGLVTATTGIIGFPVATGVTLQWD